MGTDDRLRRRGLRGLGKLVLPLAMMVAACGRMGGPAPLVTGEPSPPPPPAEVIVHRGQTLSGIAREHHVPMSVVAEANHLSPPYLIRVGQSLVIPGSSETPPYGPAVALAEPISPPPPPYASPSYAPQPGPAPPPPPVATQPVPPDHPPPTSSVPPAVAAEPPIAPTPPPTRPPTTHSTPPAATGLAETPPRAETQPPSSGPTASAAKPAPGATAAAETAPPVPRNGSTFLWPVRGHVVEGYGAGPNGTHNDGINIAAPRGAAVQATDGGVVAYAGNELRGYGNLVLIKHANGWISAYAHCDLILVKTGQKVARGQVIARVGATGNVSEPQLHFELRRGKKPVDPRGYLTPLPAVAAKEAHPG